MVHTQRLQAGHYYIHFVPKSGCLRGISLPVYCQWILSHSTGETLVGVIVDWSDAEAQGLRLAVGNDLADKLLNHVHWIRSFQRVSAKVAKLGNPEKQKIEVEAFKLVAFAITKPKVIDQVLKLFQALCGREKLADVEHIVPGIEGHYIKIVDECSGRTSATNWVQWWTRLPHLKPLRGNAAIAVYQG